MNNALFISHGGGPMPLLGDPGHQEMIDCLKMISTKLDKPSAILVISAHWEEKIPTITSGEQPELIYDYYGFPPESYKITYPCPGHPTLANDVFSCLKNSGIDARLDHHRGYDHGLFIPLKIMYPEADIPCIQLSLSSSLDPLEHINIGKALKRLSTENVLIIGSGFSFHNMKAFFLPNQEDIRQQNQAFEHWLIDTCSSNEITEDKREERLIDWDKAPSARFCHPREEHLLPLHVCYGWAARAATQVVELTIFNKKASMYYW